MAAQAKALAAKPSARLPDPIIETRHPFARLRAIHNEAEETSRLANLLGRTLYVGIALPVAALIAVALANPPAFRGLSFIVLTVMGAGAILFAYARAMRTPFDRACLRTFAADLDAIMLYAGFAWGAGAFLIVPTMSDPAIAVIFSGCIAALVAGLIQAREPVLMFAAPAGLLMALAAYLKPMHAPNATAFLAILSCSVVIVSVAFSGWMKERSNRAPVPVDPSA